MNDTWMKAGKSGLAHWIKLSGHFYTTACAVVISKDSAIRVPVDRVGLAGSPGKYYYKPVEGDICPGCERKARDQA
jgi:hypothetical protein